MQRRYVLESCSGFTLIELSIVLVIIGLIVGGILTGRDLIDAAAQRAQASQIQKYNTAANTFRVKYGYLPGDIPNPYATNFGFVTRGGAATQGDGDGMIEGYGGQTTDSAGETVMFWVDLSTAGLIDGGFNTATPATPPGADITDQPTIGKYLPAAKIGQGNYVYIYTGASWAAGPGWSYFGPNYFSISPVGTIQAATNWGKMVTSPGLTVQQAYNIDKKIDDGLPQSGGVTATYLSGVNGDLRWADGTDITTGGTPNTGATSGSSTTCYDNNNVNGATQKYSMGQNGGNGMNCALSFKCQ